MGWVPHVFGFCLCRDLGIPGCVSHTWSSAGREFDFGPDFRRHFGASGAMPRWQAWTAVSAIPVVEARDLDARVRAVEMGDTYGVWGVLAQTKSRESCGGSGPSLPTRNRCFWADSSPDPFFFCERARVRRGGSRGASTTRPRRRRARSRKPLPTHAHGCSVSRHRVTRLP
jgi:hypothetical protein